ncbi:Putative aminoglycoside phosphotransferase [Thalassocella blandensis]|nr:Putative aminoglycoside phosphotransferase [Thalassocella blandensis]
MKNDLDIEQLGNYLTANVEGITGPFTAEKFSGGQSNPTYLLNSASGQFVIRRQPSGKLLKSAHAVDREFRIQRALQHTDVPVAKVYHLCEDSQVLGAMFYVMEFVDGEIFWDPALPDVATQDREAYYQECVRILAALHNTNIATVGLNDFGKQGNYFERQFNIWQRQYRASETSRIEAMEQLILWIEKHCPEDDGVTTLVHGDFRFDNIVFAKQSARGLAVLDWELSTLGHPFADIAFFCMCLRLPSNRVFNGLADRDRQALGIPSEQEIVRHYCELRNIETISHWHFYLAFSLFRLTAILQGVLKRALDGNASSEKASYLGNMVEPLAQMAMELAHSED